MSTLDLTVLIVYFLNGSSRSNSKSFRNGGAVEAMLRSDKVYLEIICDGYYVALSYVRDVIARKGHEWVIMITDTFSFKNYQRAQLDSGEVGGGLPGFRYVEQRNRPFNRQPER